MWLWGLLGVLLVIVVLCWRIASVILFPVTHTIEQTFENEVAGGHLDPTKYNQLASQDITIQSPFGYDLFGLYFPNEVVGKTVIISHGITQNAIRSLRYMLPFYRRGFNILLIEHRNHGRSGGTNTCYGHYEKHDLTVWVDWVLQHNGDASIVGVHGESMGAAIAIQHAAIDNRTAFIVADCSFARAADEFAYRLKVEYKLPRIPFIPFANLICKLRAGYTFGSTAPMDVMPALQLPIFFIHGTDDAFIPPQDSCMMFEAKPGFKQLWLTPGSRHAASQSCHPEEYDLRVGEFLASIGIINQAGL